MESSTRVRFYIALLISLCGYGLMAYGIERSNFAALISIFLILFCCCYYSIKWVDSSHKLHAAIVGAILFRVVLLFALPALSDDFYRFIWDGNLLANGYNPFIHTPEFYMQNGLPHFLSAELFNNINSQGYYTVYPPVSQFIYASGAVLSGTKLLGNVVVMKGVVLAAEIGTIWVMKKLLDYFTLSPKWLLIYALNPLIILELTGNLHFEGVMIFFLLTAWYLFLKDKLWPAAVCFLLAVNTKLIPLILMPYLVFSLGWKRSAGLIGVVAAGTVLLHIPFLNGAFINNMGESLGLYFQSFEFNASIYYLVRWVGFQVQGYNIIQSAAPVLAALSTLIIVGISWKFRHQSLKNLPVIYIVVLGIYYLFSTTVHPWYISSLVVFAPLTGLLFPIAWSAVIPLTYITYSTAVYTENLWLVALEYIVVFTAIGYDLYYQKQQPELKNKRIFDSVLSYKKQTENRLIDG